MDTQKRLLLIIDEMKELLSRAQAHVSGDNEHFANELECYLATLNSRLIEARSGYRDPIPSYSTIFKVKDFLELANDSSLTSEDGYGFPALNDKMDRSASIVPSRIGKTIVPDDATHIVWFNK